MKKLYQLSLTLEKKGFFYANIIYVILRTLTLFISSFIVGFLLKDIVHLPATSPEVFVIIFCGWITVIFGFWGALLYLMGLD